MANKKDAEKALTKEPSPAISIFEGNGIHVKVTQGERLLGSHDRRFYSALSSQLVNAVSKGDEISQEESDFAFAVLENLKPRDEAEGMLIAQMAAVHVQAMKFARKLNHAQTIEELEVMEKTLNKLTRSFTGQMEVLRKYRNGGEQKFTVQHVNVNEGGQAVVGNINQSKSTDGKTS
jgi:hypothetical protein